MEILATTLSSAITSNEKVDAEFFKKLGSPIAEWLKKPIASVQNLIGKIAAGGKALWQSLKDGSFGSIFKQWAKDDPVAAAAGTVAAGLAAGTILVIGGATVGWLWGAVGAAITGLGAAKVLGGGGGMGQWVGRLLNSAETLYEFNWQISDKAIMEQINAAITALYEPAGEFLGRQVAGLVVGGVTTPPKIRINIRAMAFLWKLNPDIRQDLLESVSELAQQGMFAFTQIAIKYAFMQGRRAIKDLWKKMPGNVKKIFPSVDKAIKTWGDEGKEEWSLESTVNKKVESIKDEKLRNLTEGFLGGFWQQFSQSLEYAYN